MTNPRQHQSGDGYGGVPPEGDQGIFEPPAPRLGGSSDSGGSAGFFSGLARFRRGPWENLATVIIALGVVMLMQPFVMWAFTYSFITTLIGTVMFIIVSHFPEED
jgi:uncharacterized membrane protein YjjP (DUF1212 family)